MSEDPSIVFPVFWSSIQAVETMFQYDEVWMRNSLALLVLSIFVGCGLMPPEVVQIGSNITREGQNKSKICGDSSDLYIFIYFETIDINAIAVDGEMVPAFKLQKGMFGVPTISSLTSYCLEVSEGIHTFVLLATQNSQWPGAPGTFYAAKCSMQIVGGHDYIIRPKRLHKLTAYIEDSNFSENVTICPMELLQSDEIFDFVKNIREK